MDVETLSDDDTDTESIKQLHIALEVDETSRRAAASSAPSALSASSASAAPDPGVGARTESALAFNKLMDEKLIKLEKILTQRLEECRKKLLEIQGTQNSEKEEVLQTFKYVYCGKPYFKDKNLFPAPENSDTIIMKKSGMYDTSNIISICGWTIKDKRFFTNIILKMSREIAEEKLQKELYELKRKDPKNFERQQAIESEIAELSQKSLAELALPLEEEYEWDFISASLNNRHSPHEYRALWRLFLHPSINKNHWGKEEKTVLLKLAQENSLQDWDKIAKELGTGRTGYQCFVYHRTNLENSMAGKRWTLEEEEYLKRLLEYYKDDNFVSWSKIAAKMPTRTKMQIYTKYMQMAEKKGRFMKEEDEVILTSVKKYGTDYGRIAKILRGRTICQLRRRYALLTKSNRVSAVWTLEEDRRLLQLMKDQDESINFANLVEMFPGKTRVNLRTRYKTLVAWMKKHPRLDLAHAPRRGARRLGHGHAAPTLPGALENLKKRMESEEQQHKPDKKVNSLSSEDVEDAIVAALVNEEMRRNQAEEQEKYELNNQDFQCDNSANLHRLLILLKAKMNRTKFQRSKQWPKRYPGLLKIDSNDMLQSKMMSYSRSKEPHMVRMQGSVDIWGRSPLQVSCVLPPSGASLTACRRLMALAASEGRHRSVDKLCHRNCEFRAQWTRLLDRFRLLFTWPLLLSNAQPSALVPPAASGTPAKGHPQLCDVTTPKKLTRSAPIVFSCGSPLFK